MGSVALAAAGSGSTFTVSVAFVTSRVGAGVSEAAIALAMSFDDRRANLAAHGRDLSAHLEQGTLLSQPVFALAQLRQAIGVLPATVGIDAGCGRDGSRIS